MDDARRGRRKRMRTAVRDRMLALGMNQKELGLRSGLSKSSVTRLLNGERTPTMDTVERVAAALGVPPAALLEPGVAGAATRTALTTETLSGLWETSLQSPEREAGGGATGGGGGVRAAVAVYAAYALWGRDDPRAGVPVGEGQRRVMRETGSGLGGPGDVFAVLVDDEALAAIETAQGRVRAGWRLFVDRRLAAGARPGAIVAGMSATGRLAVGALELHPGGEWALFTGTQREGLERQDVLGEVVQYQPPTAAIGHIRGAAQGETTFYVGGGADGDRVALKTG